jgi:hypothetical protein
LFVTSGTWRGCIVEGYYSVDTTGFITLPPNMESLLAATKCNVPVAIFSEFHQFVEQGPGTIDPAESGGLQFFDMGDRFCTTADIPEGSSGKLRLSIHDEDDEDLTVRVMGLDENGEEIYDGSGAPGEEVVLASTPVETDHTFSKVTGVIKELTDAPVDLAWMDGATPTALATYQPYETLPLYHRYQIGRFNRESDDDNIIAIKARRRFIPLVNETDFVVPDSLNALKWGLRALEHENGNLNDSAMKEWQMAYQILNQQHRAARGAARYTINWKGGKRQVRNSH